MISGERVGFRSYEEDLTDLALDVQVDGRERISGIRNQDGVMRLITVIRAIEQIRDDTLTRDDRVLEAAAREALEPLMAFLESEFLLPPGIMDFGGAE